MSFFSVIEALVYGLTEEVSKLVEPCLTKMGEKKSLLKLDHTELVEDVLEYFQSGIHNIPMPKVFEITNKLVSRLACLKKLPVSRGRSGRCIRGTCTPPPPLRLA